jgi:hypothetical protein
MCAARRPPAGRLSSLLALASALSMGQLGDLLMLGAGGVDVGW